MYSPLCSGLCCSSAGGLWRLSCALEPSESLSFFTKHNRCGFCRFSCSTSFLFSSFPVSSIAVIGRIFLRIKTKICSVAVKEELDAGLY